MQNTISEDVSAGKLEEPKRAGLAKINWFWQNSTGVLAPVLLTLLVLRLSSEPTISWFEWLLWLHLPLVMFHEFEEYVLPGGFRQFFNNYTALSLDPPSPNYPLDERKVFVINIGVWVWIILGAIFANTAPWIGVSAVIFQIMNAVAHTFVMATKRSGHNPGLITTVFLLTPYIVVALWVSITQGILGPVDWIISCVVGLGSIVALIYFSNFYNRPS